MFAICFCQKTMTFNNLFFWINKKSNVCWKCSFSGTKLDMNNEWLNKSDSVCRIQFIRLCRLNVRWKNDVINALRAFHWCHILVKPEKNLFIQLLCVKVQKYFYFNTKILVFFKLKKPFSLSITSEVKCANRKNRLFV